jgi:hypothetical protein
LIGQIKIRLRQNRWQKIRIGFERPAQQLLSGFFALGCFGFFQQDNRLSVFALSRLIR